MMSHYKADDQVIFALELTDLCKALHTLPRSGGLLDQDWYHVALLKAGLRAYALKEQKQLEAAKNKR